VLDIHRPTLDVYGTVSGADIELLRVIQRFPAFGVALDDLRLRWQPAALTHNDLRWDNIVVARDSDSDLQLIDWELVGRGDPCWDIGTFVSEYLSFWVYSIPPTSHSAAGSRHAARHQIEDMQPAIRAFWNAYRQQVQDGGGADLPLDRAVRCAGARLLQTAFEHTRTRDRPTTNDLLLLQLSLNVLQRPDDVAARLLGLTG
jgi:hypothetical protein